MSYLYGVGTVLSESNVNIASNHEPKRIVANIRQHVKEARLREENQLEAVFLNVLKALGTYSRSLSIVFSIV